MPSQRCPRNVTSQERTSLVRSLAFGATRLDEVSCVAFAILFGALSLRLRYVPLWLVLLAVGIAFPAADLLSGMVHWAADTWGSSATPFLGTKLIAPFREHHHDPQAILAHGFIAANGAACLLALPIAAGALSLPVMRSAIAGAALAFVWGLLLFGALTNQFHAWAHAKRPPRLVAWLQRRRLILEPVHHAMHHTAHVKHYCVTSGWLNPWLEASRAFPRLEQVVTKLTGRRPRAA